MPELSQSASKVQAALQALELPCKVVELPGSTRTAVEAAQAVGCEVAQIVKSLIFMGAESRRPVMVVASGVNRVNESRLAELLGTTAQVGVNSLHHQGISRLADGLVCTATAPDGLIEAVEVTGHPFGLAVQWHPEWLPEVAPMQRLFQGLVAAARVNSHSKP